MTVSAQLTRQWSLLTAISRSHTGMTVYELAREYEVSEKTIRRDLDVLKTTGFPITERRIDNGQKRWQVDSARTTGLTFDITEVAALNAGRRFLEQLAGTHFWDGSNSAFRKIRATLGDSALAYLEKLSQIFHVTRPGASDYSKRAEIIDQLMIAIEDRKITFIVYQSMRATEPVSTEIYPLGLVHHRGSLYLVAKSVEANEIRHYKIDRVEEVDIQNIPFVELPGFDFREWISQAFGVYRSTGTPQTIRIHFDREASRYVQESRWHHSQQLTVQTDGTVIAAFTLPDTTEIKRWVMSFGSAATVLEPEELVEDIRQEIEQMQAAYESVRRDVDP